MTPQISVIIPTYNRAEDLRRALQSVRAQTYEDWETLVVDNCSDDHTDLVVESFRDPRIHLFKIHNNGIIAASRNKGLQEAAGEYVAFLDSDDWWMPGKLEEAFRCLEQGYDICYHDLWITKREKWQFLRRRLKGRAATYPMYSDLIKNGNPIGTSSVVVRRDLMRRIDGQSEDPKLVAAEDFDCWLRVAKESDKFCYLPRPLGCYWMGGENTSNPLNTIRFMKRLRALHINPHIEQTGLGSPLWWDYGYARALYLSGDYVTARPLLKELAGNHSAPWLIALRVRAMRARLPQG